ncbi:MAG: hypothetical protein IPK97_18470 [Ahniella sp.]|nr:hypothetical protein [Ahniella sp.]
MNNPVRVLSGWCLTGLLLLLTLSPVQAQDLCPANDPNSWPERRVPYVLVIADTSGSMTTTIGTVDSCGYGNDRRSHQRCALDRTFKAFTGLIDFSLMSFATQQTNCSAVCFGTCQYSNFAGNADGVGCGPEPTPGTNSETRRGGVVQVPFKGNVVPPTANGNYPSLRAQVDNVCTNQQELFASGNAPINGALRDAFRYFSSSWTALDNSVIHATPLTSVAAGELPCRPLRVILLADGDDNCDVSTDAVDAAADLLTGFTVNGINWSVRTHVIALAGGAVTLDQIANAGGTGLAIPATQDQSIVDALSSILLPLAGSEVADNVDNSCNGCVDEGYVKYANIGQTCCAWANQGQRPTCLNTYQASISPANPQGSRALLPCTTLAQQADPTTWLTYNPGEICDNVDNNGVGGIDEGMLKCGNPLQCPVAESCDGVDNDCDGQIDEGGVCGGAGCIYQPEICDGCDNDCDSVADNGVPAVSCGLATPANCAGILACRPAQPVAMPGACVANGGFNSCAISPQPESCDAIDNNCDGIVDDNIAPTPCEPAGTPPGLVYGGSSQCIRGQLSCGDSVCRGFVGPTPEVSDGIDNNCNGQVEDGIDVMFRNGFE